MKFLTQALALAVTTFTSVEAHKTFSKPDFEQAVADGKYDRKKLLRNAVPYKPEGAKRRAQDEEDQAYADGYGYESQYYNDDYSRLDVTSKVKIQFNACLTLENENYNLLSDDLYDFSKGGTIVSVRNYVLFDLCDGDDCEQQTWMVDLLSFIEAVVDYDASRKTAICDACQTYGEDMCTENSNSNGGRRLDDGNNVEYEVFDADMCSLCEEYWCWNNADGDDQQMDVETVESWITTLAECTATQATWNGFQTYSSWMCNADGSGIEIGVFLDEYCRMYHTNYQFESIMTADDSEYFSQAQAVIQNMFTDIIECRDLSSVQFVDEDTFEAIEAAQGNSSSYQESSGVINDACLALFYGDFVPRSTSNCGQTKNWTDAELMAQQQNYTQDDEANEMYQYIQEKSMMYSNNDKDTSWYTFDLGFFEVLDEAAVCEKAVSKWYSAQSSGIGIQNAYNSEASYGFWSWVTGNTGSYSSSSSSSSSSSKSSSSKNNEPTWLFPTRNNHSTIQTPNTRLSPLEIAWIVLLSVGVTALFMHFTRRQVIKHIAKRDKKRQGLLDKEIYVKTDGGGTPLIIS